MRYKMTQTVSSIWDAAHPLCETPLTVGDARRRFGRRAVGYALAHGRVYGTRVMVGPAWSGGSDSDMVYPSPDGLVSPIRLPDREWAYRIKTQDLLDSDVLHSNGVTIG